ncbi:uncharacterized protein E0L32_005155 [Thyridium curvatum]|uniref:Zn(2)-C6 fungal-type domain-containing protein n=1 Tax=Thyridium curvatum TaxID=1093900 RepID=A0A507BE13_9PEZI|nr:uncharacterized protein E0L32_005155 [Thyridium curvatum]TPX14760.1 hypothetical protein E0L32_005155 [Thyridium curvatum]
MAASTNSPTSTISDTTSVRPVACLRCRQRRSGCSKERPQCSRCRDSGFECVYEEARKITINESYLRELEAKVKEYEALKADQVQTQSAPVQVPMRTRPFNVSDDEEIEDKLPLLEPFNHLSVSVPGRPSVSFKGPGSSDNFLRSVRKLSGLYGDDGSLDTNANFYDPGALPSRRSSLRSRARLPPMDIARRLFAAQYTYIGTIFFFTDPETFEQLLLEAYRGPPDTSDQEACLAYAKVLMILAFGQLYSINQWIDFKGPPGFDYFTAALDLLPDAHEEGSILCVETLAYVGYFMQNMNRRDAAFLYIGMALRMAISLGLHQEVSGPGLDETTKEHRRRVWWSIYSLDRIVSVKSGNPLTIQDEDIGIAMPSKLPSEPEYCPAVVLRHYTELSRILGEVLSFIYRKTPKSGSRLMESVRNIMMALAKWHRELPDGLRFDPAKLSISRESVSTLLHYYQCINMTARPLLFHVVQRRLKTSPPGGAARRAGGGGGGGAGGNKLLEQQDWRAGLSQTTIRVIEMCISAAQDTINMMTVAAQRDLVATYGYMDGEHAFSAAIVLVMACGAFPANAQSALAMNAGLDLLRGMAQRGNSHMGARYELLAHLKSILMPDDDAGTLGAAVRPFAPSAAAAAAAAAAAVPTSTPPSNTSPGSGGAVPQQTAVAAAAPANRAANPGMMMLGHVPNVGGADVGIGGLLGFGAGAEMPTFPLVMANSNELGDMFYDVDVNLGGGVGGGDDDFMLWEEGFADPAGYDLTQWTQATQMAVDGGVYPNT